MMNEIYKKEWRVGERRSRAPGGKQPAESKNHKRARDDL